MANFKNAISEVKGTLAKLIIFDTIINTILVFLIALLLFSLFGMFLVYPLALSVVYFVYVISKRMKMSKISLVEQKYRNLNEKLRTADEYASESNPVVKELHSEVVSDLRKVEEAAFLNEKRIYVKSVGIVALCFVILLLSPVTFGLIDFNFNLVEQEVEEPEDQLTTGPSGDSKIRFAVGNENTGLRKASEDIYGEPIVAKLGDDEIKIKIKPAGSELSIREIQQVDLPVFSESYPIEVHAVAAAIYEEEIPKEDLELVKSYFNQLSKS
jgi:ABC-type multidrug transport system fused ATPase/permease subunit